ncbi:exopolysaccharide polymerization/transport protein [Roseibium polysiphoniae]|uniref:Exopolysaccharide polymerization/transport protein n=1 Tax=Roseibium polysiphoniae TaxID=2571221 RepID=A0A944GVF9_9HYPH|nr:GumC family protein [Roseibium polysiphoniae]MBS8262405.1 exopolysaccharide polymerization/transport protein [Roseibium polysiphoniae]
MIDIADIPKLLMRHLGLLICAPIVLIVLAIFFLSLRTPLYSSTSELLVEPEGQNFLVTETGAAGSSQSLQNFDIDSQTYIILSAAVLNEVANTLDLDNDPGLHRVGLRQKLFGTADRRMSDSEKRAATLGSLRDSLQASRLGRSFVFQISATHADPVIAATIANETARSYISQLRGNRSEALTRVSTSLGQQARDLRARVDAAEIAVETYKAENGLISTGQGGLVVDQQIQALNTQIAQARVDLEKAKTTYNLIAPLTPADVEAGGIPQTASSAVLTTLRIQYAQIAQQEAEAATTLGASHPTLRELESQLENTRRQIASELQRIKRAVKSQYEQAQGTLTALETQSTNLQSANSKQGQALIELRQLQSEADTSREIYEAFLKRSRELEEQPELNTNATRVLSEAQPSSSPNGPRKSIVALAAGLFGFALAASAIIGVAILRGQISSEQDLLRRTGAPLLANIPSERSRPSTNAHEIANRFFGASTDRSNQRYIALTRLAYALRQAYADERPANILVLSTDNSRDTFAFTREVAIQLHEMGEDVLYAAANQEKTKVDRDRLTSRSQISASGRDGIEFLTQIASPRSKATLTTTNSADQFIGSGLSRHLTIERIDTRRKYASHGALEPAADDFLIVDGGAASQSPILPVLLRHCDGIILVSSLGKTSIGSLDKTLAYLQPWRERVIGNVVLEAA